MPLLATVLQALQVGFAFLVIITILVAVHELGHYLFARWSGMHVDAFAVMMGGIRKTDLTPQLQQPLGSAVPVWTFGILSGAAAILGAFEDWNGLFLGGMVGLAIIGPVWVIVRLAKLYHLPVNQVMKTLGICWAVALGVLLLGTGFQIGRLDIGYVLGTFVWASAAAVMLVYYHPVMRKAEDSPMGHGQITVEGQEIPVRFRPVWAVKDKRGTEFSLLLLPLGGFAAMRGMHPKEDGSETKIEGGFYSKSPLARFMVLGAGPAFSILFGVILLMGVYMSWGVDVPTNRIVGFGGVARESAAFQAGLQVGDEVISVNGQPINGVGDVAEALKSNVERGTAGMSVTPAEVVIERDGQQLTREVLPMMSDQPVPEIDREGNPTGNMVYRPLLGINFGYELKPLAPGEAFTRALLVPARSVAHLARVFTNADVARNSVGGPGSMVTQTSQAVESGMRGLIEMAALLSISLGVLNLLPFPPLDGGQMVIAFIEMLRGGRRLSLQVQQSLSTVGMFLVMGLMLAAFALDAGRKASSDERGSSSRQEQNSPR